MNRLIHKLTGPTVLNHVLIACLVLPVAIYAATLLINTSAPTSDLSERLNIAISHQVKTERLHEAARSDLLAGLLAWTNRDSAGLQTARDLAQTRGQQANAALNQINAVLEPTELAGAANPAKTLLGRSFDEISQTIDESALERSEIKVSQIRKSWEQAAQSLDGLRQVLDAQLVTAQARPVIDLAISPSKAATALVLIALLGWVCARQLLTQKQRAARNLEDQLETALNELRSMPADPDRPISYCLDTSRQALSEFQHNISATAIATRTMHELGHHAKHVANDGSERLDELAGTIAQLDENSQRVNRSVSELEQIAFRTNVLALNAQVEAARAGNQGRSFAILADEVRSLALRSAETSSKMRARLAENSARASSGSQLASGIAQTMRELTDTVVVLGAQLDDLRDGTGGQEDKIKNVAQAVNGLKEVERDQANWRTRRQEVISLLEATQASIDEAWQAAPEQPSPRFRRTRPRQTPGQWKSHLFENSVQRTDTLDTQPLESVDKFGNQQFGR